jgi:hypothetical protein
MGEAVYVYVYNNTLLGVEEFNLLNPKPTLPQTGKDGTALGSFELVKQSTCDGHTSLVFIDIDNNDLYIKRCCEKFGLKTKKKCFLF